MIKQFVVPILGIRNLVANWFVITFAMPKNNMAKPNCDSVILSLSRSIGVCTKKRLTKIITITPWE